MKKQFLFGPLAVVLVVLFSFAALLTCSVAGDTIVIGDEEAPAPPGKQEIQQQLLSGMGVPTDWIPPVDRNGNPLPDGYNPLDVSGGMGAKKALRHTYEVYRAGVDPEIFASAIEGSGRDVAEAEEYFMAESLGIGRFAYDGFEDTFYGAVEKDKAEFQTAVDGQSIYASTMYKGFKGGWTSTDDELVTIKSDNPEGAWLREPKKAIGGDFDGDGYDEVIVFAAYMDTGEVALREGRGTATTSFSEEVHRITISSSGLSSTLPVSNGVNPYDEIIYDDEGNVIEINPYTDMDEEECFGKLYMRNEFQFYRFDLAKGDIDQDGMDEILLAIGGTVILFNYDPTEGTWTDEEVDSFEDFGEYSTVSIACGDFDNDGYDDWVEAYADIRNSATNAQFRIFNGVRKEQFAINNSFGDIVPNGYSYLLSSVNVETGDFDGDGLPEIAFCGRHLDSKDYILYILDTYLNDNSEVSFKFLDPGYNDKFELNTKIAHSGSDTPWLGSEIPALVCGDFNDDGLDDIFAVSTIFSYSSAGQLLPVWKQDTGNNVYYDLAVAGDVDGDSLADIVYLDWRGRLVSITREEGEYKKHTLTNYNFMLPECLTGIKYFPTLALANVDDDGYIFEYQGAEMAFTNPIPASVVSAAPFYGDASYSMGLETLFTTYGAMDIDGLPSSAGGHEIQADMSVSLFLNGASKGAQVDGMKLAYLLEVRTTEAAVSGSAIAGPMESFTTFVAISGKAMEDTVAFAVVPYYMYSYYVIGAPANNEDGPGGEEIMAGDVVHFNYPGPVGVYTVNLDFYNSHNGYEPDLPAPHIVGSPFTYSNLDDLTYYKAESTGKGVYDQSAVSFVTRENKSWVTKEISEVAAADKSLDWTLEALTASLNADESEDNHVIKHKITNGLYISGQVPNVPTGASAKSLFQWGFLMYPYTEKENGMAFNYLTYWVEAEDAESSE